MKKETLINNAIKKGIPKDNAEDLLENLKKSLSEVNYICALEYWGFISNKTAEKLLMQL